MDRRLFEAARLGSVEALLEMLAGDPLILERVPLAQDTPLHVAVLAGKAEFAKEILRQRPRYALELNKDGFSPIHIAAINGDIELVREFLKVDSSLCSLKDRDGRTPIHLASMKMRLDVMGELLSACPESAREVTVQGETILHLVVKSNQFEAFKVLVERAPFHDILNAKDQDGNTILHLAVCRKQIQTVELLLYSKSESMVEVNARNLKNLTAMDLVDILLQSSCDEGYFIVGRLLLRAIERYAQSQETIEVTASHDQMERANFITPGYVYESVPKKGLWKEFSEEISRDLDNASSKTRNALMVVAVLIATVTFQAGVSPPGGFRQDDLPAVSNGTSTQTVYHRAGEAIMASRIVCFLLFFSFNTTGFLISLIMISLLTSRFPLKPWLRLAVISMISSYACAVCFISPYHRWRFGRSLHITLLMPVFFIGAVASWKFWWLKKWASVIRKRWSRN